MILEEVLGLSGSLAGCPT